MQNGATAILPTPTTDAEKPSATLDSGDQSDQAIKQPVPLRQNYNLKVGEADKDGQIIEQIFVKEEGNYLIYSARVKNNSKEIQLKVSAENESLLSGNTKVTNLLYQIGDYCSKTPEIKPLYASSVAFAIKIFFDGNTDGALDAFRCVVEDIKRHLKRRTEFSYVFGALLFMLLTLLVFWLENINRWLFDNYWLSDVGYILLCAAAFSSLGGFFSVAIGANKIKIDIQNNRVIHFFHGALRVVIAIISGVLAYFIVDSKLAFSFLQDGSGLSGMILLFFVSGFSERLIPNIMLDFEGRSKPGKTAENSCNQSDK